MSTVESQGVQIYYESVGDGPGLLFAHGAGGNTLSWWQQVPHFADRFRVVTIDHRGFARSRCTDADFHPRHFASDAVAVLDACGCPSAVLVCQSMGGWTGLHTAIEHPDRVDGLVLCGTPGGLLTPAVVEAASKIGTRLGDEGVRGNAALAPDYPSREPAMAFLYDQISLRNDGLDPAWLGRMFDEHGRVDPSALDGYSVSTLMMAGECDQLFPPSALREVADLIPGATLRELPGLGHSTYFEDAAQFNAILDGFLASLS